MGGANIIAKRERFFFFSQTDNSRRRYQLLRLDRNLSN